MRRQGRMTKGQETAFEKYWLQYGLEPTTSYINYEDIFQRDAKTILEIGFGMGQSLFEMAQNNLDNNFIGIEVHRPGVGALLAKLSEHKLDNVRVYCHDAVEILEQCIPDNSLDGVYILFPDPWPKKRHHKRRLIQIEFIKLIQAKLKPNGLLHMATDWENYAEHIIEVMQAVAGFTKIEAKARPSTKFEARGERLGHQIWDLCYKK